MAMLDKEVAEERAEIAEAELEDVKERLAIAEVELEVLKEGEEGRFCAVMGSFGFSRSLQRKRARAMARVLLLLLRARIPSRTYSSRSRTNG